MPEETEFNKYSIKDPTLFHIYCYTLKSSTENPISDILRKIFAANNKLISNSDIDQAHKTPFWSKTITNIASQDGKDKIIILIRYVESYMTIWLGIERSGNYTLEECGGVNLKKELQNILHSVFDKTEPVLSCHPDKEMELLNDIFLFTSEFTELPENGWHTLGRLCYKNNGYVILSWGILSYIDYKDNSPPLLVIQTGHEKELKDQRDNMIFSVDFNLVIIYIGAAFEYYKKFTDIFKNTLLPLVNKIDTYIETIENYINPTTPATDNIDKSLRQQSGFKLFAILLNHMRINVKRIIFSKNTIKDIENHVLVLDREILQYSKDIIILQTYVNQTQKMLASIKLFFAQVTHGEGSTIYSLQSKIDLLYNQMQSDFDSVKPTEMRASRMLETLRLLVSMMQARISKRLNSIMAVFTIFFSVASLVLKLGSATSPWWFRLSIIFSISLPIILIYFFINKLRNKGDF